MVQDEEFVNCIRTGLPSATPGERGLDIVRVLAATDAALATGRTAGVTRHSAASFMRSQS
jgi:hypothetical protein